MINEIAEFEAYTGTIEYKAKKKRDNSYLGRFTFDMLTGLKGFSRVLTIIARGYMWQDGAGPQKDRAAKALLAWCSIPENETEKEEWQFRTAFPELHGEFPELVDGQGRGWLCRHVHHITEYVFSHPEDVQKPSIKQTEKLENVFDEKWRTRVCQLQNSMYSPNTYNNWVLRFDDVLSDALLSGPLRNPEPNVPGEVLQKAVALKPKDATEQQIFDILAFYYANKQEDTDWVVLPEINFDAYFGNTTFSKKWIDKLPPEVFEKQANYGVCRIRIKTR